jgi:hypothetical protein
MPTCGIRGCAAANVTCQRYKVCTSYTAFVLHHTSDLCAPQQQMLDGPLDFLLDGVLHFLLEGPLHVWLEGPLKFLVDGALNTAGGGDLAGQMAEPEHGEFDWQGQEGEGQLQRPWQSWRWAGAPSSMLCASPDLPLSRPPSLSFTLPCRCPGVASSTYTLPCHCLVLCTSLTPRPVTVSSCVLHLRPALSLSRPASFAYTLPVPVHPAPN